MDLIKKLDELSERYKEVSQLITDPNLLKDQKKYKDTMRENQYLSTLMELYDEYKKVLSGIEDAKMMITAEDDPETETREDQASISWYVFPSIGPYTCDISFTLNAEDHGYTDLPVHDDHARDISQLARNQHLTITTRIGKGKNVSFNFEVSGWDDKTETVTFN